MIDKDEIIRLRKLKYSQAYIANVLNCSESYVWLVLKEAGMTEFKMSMSPFERLQRKLKINSANDCWEFQGSKTNGGYGQIKINRVNYRAHVLAYSLFVGEIPDGLLVLHKCDNPPCCNPDHLFLGTNADNMMDKVEKGRCPKGNNLPQTKVTNNLITEMCELRKQGHTFREIAKRLGVSKTTVSRHIERRND